MQKTCFFTIFTPHGHILTLTLQIQEGHLKNQISNFLIPYDPNTTKHQNISKKTLGNCFPMSRTYFGPISRKSSVQGYFFITAGSFFPPTLSRKYSTFANFRFFKRKSINTFATSELLTSRTSQKGNHKHTQHTHKHTNTYRNTRSI